MGQLYTIFADLRFDDPRAVAGKFDEYFAWAQPGIFEGKSFADDDIYARLKAIAGDYESLGTVYTQHRHRVEFSTTFYATYLGRLMLENMFDAMVPVLRPGSSLTMYPKDDGLWTRRVPFDGEEEHR